ncbi:hypothetical protein JCM11641_007235 [Rhodosporidiobolus odoratus]
MEQNAPLRKPPARNRFALIAAGKADREQKEPSSAPKGAVFGLEAFLDEISDFDSPAGLFLGLSIFDHSCQSNAYRLPVGDLIAVRAVSPISAGAEVFVPYVSVEAPAKKREGSKLLGKVASLVESVKKASVGLFSSTTATKKAQLSALISNLETTYSPSRGPLKPELAEPYHRLAEFFQPRTPTSRLEGIALEKKALAAIGTVVVVEDNKSGKVTITRGPPGGGILAPSLLLSIAWRLNAGRTPKAKSEAKVRLETAARLSRMMWRDDGKRFKSRLEKLPGEFHLKGLV